MKTIKRIMLPSLAALLLTGCIDHGDNDNRGSQIYIGDSQIEGTEVGEPEKTDTPSYYKMFVLNEGIDASKKASLDFYRFSDYTYVQSAFSKMNTSSSVSLGTEAKDMVIVNNTLIIASPSTDNLIYLSAVDETLIGTVSIPDCQKIAVGTGQGFLYVSSYNGAKSSSDTKGCVYKVESSSGEVVSRLEVGYQPTAIGVSSSKVFVANTGEYHGSAEKTVSVLDESGFSEIASIEVADGLCDLFVNSKSGDVWVGAMGSKPGFYKINPSTLEVVKYIECEYSVAAMASDNNIYALSDGDENEQASLLKLDTTSDSITSKSSSAFISMGKASSIAVNTITGDYFIADKKEASEGTLWCFKSDLSIKWRTTAGVNPAKILFYNIVY